MYLTNLIHIFFSTESSFLIQLQKYVLTIKFKFKQLGISITHS